jgi:beta-lactamase superfamily II metal-dependent hydrolase
MVTKTSQPKVTANRPKSKGGGARSAQGVRIRMYRQGLGDCFLVMLPQGTGGPYTIMIDCGVILGTSNAAATMQAVVKSIAETTGGRVDLLVCTHEHWDHLSGFVQAKHLFSKIRFDQIWLAWTENPEDELAKKLRSESEALRLALASAAARLRFGGDSTGIVDGMLEFFGAAGQGTTAEALQIVKNLCDKPRYCTPTDAPVELGTAGARLYVLGPPHDEKEIKRVDPSKGAPETYGIALYLDRSAPGLGDPNRDAPFDPILQIPFNAARQMPFFQQHYWGEAETSEDQSWRRIDSDWLDSSSAMALALDNATNNTSLVLAVELADGRVLLFAADAQVGNWLSWQDLSWKVGGKVVTGPDLLRRTTFYKTGHHGSHNATLKEKGLEMMTNLKIAMIPVDHAMAVKKRWGAMPLDKLEQRLNEITNRRVLRIDKDPPVALAGSVAQDDAQRLYYEVTL